MIIAVQFHEFAKEILSKLLWAGSYRALKQNQLKTKLLSEDIKMKALLLSNISK